MIRLLMIGVFCFSMVACMNNDDDDDDTPKNPKTNPITDNAPGVGLNPTGSMLSLPPTDGNLPEELKPPV